MDELESEAAIIGDIEYTQMAEQRRHYDTMLWATPATTLTGLAFLFTIALGDGNLRGRLIASVLAFLVSLAAVQLLSKHRQYEVHYSKMLAHVERKRFKAHVRTTSTGWMRWSSYLLWKTLFWVFAGAAVVNAVLIASGV